MKQSQKYFVFNKERDYMRGFGWNLELSSKGIRIKDKEKGTGYFFSRLLDSKEKGVCWHRMRAKVTEQKDASIHISIYLSESRTIMLNGEEIDVDELIHQEELSILRKKEWMKPYLVKDVYMQEDMLLHDMTGRYLWFIIEFSCHGELSPEINFIQFIFPKVTWLSYLPEIYEQDRKSADFLERFLGIFQTIYSDMTDEINHVSRYFEPRTVSREFLLWLAEWLAVEDVYLWTEEQLRYLLQNSMRMYQQLGTVSYLKEIVWLYTGKEPFVVEHHQLEQFQSDYKAMELLHQLYSDNTYKFSIIVDTGSITSYQKYRTLTRIVENAKPAHMECNVVVLKPYIFLDHYSYLGINSRLERYQDLQLDGFSSIPFTTIKSNH